MKRAWIIVMAALLAASLAAPAAAKGRPAPPAPALYQVTMSMEGAEGLATTCGTLIMRSEQNAYVADGSLGTSVPWLELAAAIPWSRLHPTASSGTAFSGCHGGPVDPALPNQPNGLLRITKGPQGTPIDLLWHFDYYLAGTQVGKRFLVADRENFTLGTGAFTPTDDDKDGVNEVKALFQVSHYLNGTYTPFTPTRELHFELTITPIG